MTKQEGILLFNSMHPDFFESEHIRKLPDDWIFDEMVLPLDEFEPCRYDRKLAENVSFGFFQGDIAAVKEAVAEVDDDWPQYFTEGQRIYCGYVDGKIVSFCTVADLGVHDLNGRKVKIGGPGCVGTLPAFRDMGIGLTMVKNVTRLLKEEGFDYSYIHFTSVAA